MLPSQENIEPGKGNTPPPEESKSATPVNLHQMQEEVEQLAKAHGLDFFPIVFEKVSSRELNAIAAKEGYPIRYPHWRWGVEFKRLDTPHEHGLSKIYELVINNDPVYAYLRVANSELDQKLVMAHVCGHADFFKHNKCFEHTERNMLDQLANHASRIRGYMDTYGRDQVERWIDTCRSVENLIDLFELKPSGFRPVSELVASGQASPAEPTRDIMKLLLEHAELEDWQRDILSIVRREAHYFQAQRRTKIMNEGWASFWHAKLMSESLLLPKEVVNYCKCHAGVVSVGGKKLNPYKIGIEIFRDLEKQGEEIANSLESNQPQATLSLAFQVRRDHSDITFITRYLTPKIAMRCGLLDPEIMQSDPEQAREHYLERKSELLSGLTPVHMSGQITARGELEITHLHDGRDLDLDKAKVTIENLQQIISIPVRVKTTCQEKQAELLFDGETHRATGIEDYSNE